MDDYYRNKELVEIEQLLKAGHRKWGWIIYRTTYEDDEKWARFEEKFQKEVRAPTLDRDAGEEIHVKYLDFPVRSDATKYNKATTAELRADFQKWLSGDGPLKEQEIELDDREKFKTALRYMYFIRINAEAMESVLDGEFGWVDLVQVQWPEDDEDARIIASEDGYPPVEGMTTYKIGFQRVEVIVLYPFCWMDLDSIADRVFGVARPPQISYDD